MSKRLQVLIGPAEYRGFQRLARQAGMSLGEWVRQALRRIASSTSRKSAEQKLEHIQKYSRYTAPTGDIEEILSDIEKGYLS